MVQDIDRIFKPVNFEFDRIHIAGGYTSNPSPVTSRTVDESDNKQHVFVKMAGKEHWLMNAVCGGPSNSVRARTFGRTTLLDVLRMHIQRKSDGADDPDDVPHIGNRNDDYDPMDDIGSAAGMDDMGVQTQSSERPTTKAGHVITGTVLRTALSR